ncbi:D-tyrosyl-tRNA(Tyr) deacylase [Nocardioides mangrovicus]|uniref:D-aminoacyl-tRNA deacylase n=1 Tax=Nocardioides mangrovicus TaxID=2478913 RepID=A0A3L8NY96_9ACTN|nr:D-aminoacyl-tRNA deacylase [Nocardioides mangrovicus]RLV47672.1 D-tyrosyl-tRNA(Tyr) deacylase [Nocardioides mangrovicus]
MRAVVSRVRSASVSVEGRVVGAVEGPGLLVLLGVTHGDGPEQATWLAGKIATLRILREEVSVLDAGGAVLAISQFTLYGQTRKGRRPTWEAAAPGPVAEPLYEAFCEALAATGVRVERGVFGAEMAVASVNDGPFTLVVDSV